jgi:hypothetical protein
MSISVSALMGTCEKNAPVNWGESCGSSRNFAEMDELAEM